MTVARSKSILLVSVPSLPTPYSTKALSWNGNSFTVQVRQPFSMYGSRENARGRPRRSREAIRGKTAQRTPPSRSCPISQSATSQPISSRCQLHHTAVALLLSESIG